MTRFLYRISRFLIFISFSAFPFSVFLSLAPTFYVSEDSMTPILFLLSSFFIIITPSRFYFSFLFFLLLSFCLFASLCLPACIHVPPLTSLSPCFSFTLWDGLNNPFPFDQPLPSHSPDSLSRHQQNFASKKISFL